MIPPTADGVHDGGKKGRGEKYLAGDTFFSDPLMQASVQSAEHGARNDARRSGGNRP